MGNGYQVFCPGLGGREREREERRNYTCRLAQMGVMAPRSVGTPMGAGGTSTRRRDLTLMGVWRWSPHGGKPQRPASIRCLLLAHGTAHAWWPTREGAMTTCEPPPGTRGWERVGIEWEQQGLGGQGWLLTGGERQGLGGQGEGVADRWGRRIKTIIY
jgi:hypothetical protein